MGLNYLDTCKKTTGKLWRYPLGDDEIGLAKSPYDHDCQTLDDESCNLSTSNTLGGGSASTAPYGWCDKNGGTMHHPANVCCRPMKYASVAPRWNWIIGTCLGKNCLAGNRPQDNSAKDIGTRTVVNYVGSYQYDSDSKVWHVHSPSSFNMDGAEGSQDLMAVEGPSWMPGPLPGGAANWGAGYYPAGREGVGPPAFAFIFSVERVFNIAWYMLNQATLDRGPAYTALDLPQDQWKECLNVDPSKVNAADLRAASNTWFSARSGEYDILESPMLGGNPQSPFQNDEYMLLYSNSSVNAGSNGMFMQWSGGDDGRQGGNWYNPKFFRADYPNGTASPRVFFCIMDKNGVTAFQIPTYEGAPVYWPGISRTSACATLPGTFDQTFTPCTGACDDPEKFCAVFMPACNTDDPTALAAYHCLAANGTARDSGFCGSFHNSLADTGNVWGKTPGLPLPAKVNWTGEMQTAANQTTATCQST